MHVALCIRRTEVNCSIDFTVAHIVAVLEIEHNSWHSPYSKALPYRHGKLHTRIGVGGDELFGAITKIHKPRWGASYETSRIRQGKEADINKIIRLAIKTKKFLESKRPPICKTGIHMPYGVTKAIWEQPVTDEEWNFGFDYGDYDKLINFNPYERMN
jgi:hypothetical protein